MKTIVQTPVRVSRRPLTSERPSRLAVRPSKRRCRQRALEASCPRARRDGGPPVVPPRHRRRPCRELRNKRLDCRVAGVEFSGGDNASLNQPSVPHLVRSCLVQPHLNLSKLAACRSHLRVAMPSARARPNHPAAPVLDRCARACPPNQDFAQLARHPRRHRRTATRGHIAGSGEHGLFGCTRRSRDHGCGRTVTTRAAISHHQPLISALRKRTGPIHRTGR